MKKSMKTKEAISLAVFILMRKKPYEEITVKEICERAGISRMSFYRYYNQKDDIFVDFCDLRFEEFYSQFSKNPNVTMKEFVLSILLYFKKYSKQLLTLQEAGKSQILLGQLNSYSRYVFATLKSNYAINKKDNPLIASFLSGGLFNVLMLWLKEGMKRTPEETADLIFAIFDK
ncbi:MAG: TetR/AcrR family transcriptional regulator [Bacilli bacterium]|nr:TetR/AcrR family transcriptional regulator [Bacilli bacterium]